MTYSLERAEDERLELRIHSSPWRGGYEIAFISKGADKYFCSGPLVMHEVGRADRIEPMAQLPESVVQGMFNELWRLGFRPKDGTGNSGHIEALKYHLEDMRNLVFLKEK